MPDAGGDETYRFVVDESSFILGELTADQLAELLHPFNTTLADLLEQRHNVAVSPFWSETECGPGGRELYDVLYASRDPRGYDERLLMGSLMDRCPSWDTGLPGLTDRVTVGEDPIEPAWSLGYALWQGKRGHHVGCLVLPSAARRGWRPASGGGAESEVFFLAETSTVPEFWRGLFARENVPQSEFFSRMQVAFPELVFADSLTFRKFDGGYRDLREWVVEALTVIHDHFATAWTEHEGNGHVVQQVLGSHGLDLSPESTNTRANKSVMKQREVSHGGEDYLCEWHAKQHPARNRVHFSLPDPRLGDRILVGIFVDHLDT